MRWSAVYLVGFIFFHLVDTTYSVDNYDLYAARKQRDKDWDANRNQHVAQLASQLTKHEPHTHSTPAGAHSGGGHGGHAGSPSPGGHASSSSGSHPGHQGSTPAASKQANAGKHAVKDEARTPSSSGGDELSALLSTSLHLRSHLRRWGRLPPLPPALIGAEAYLRDGSGLLLPLKQKEKELEAEEALSNDDAFLRWSDILLRVGKNSAILKDMALTADLGRDLFSTIDALSLDEPRHAQSNEDEALQSLDDPFEQSLGISAKDAARLQAVDTACKDALPGEEEVGWCVDALPLSGRFKREERQASCALVGNSQRLLLGTFGPSIDNHTTVLRLNHAPTTGIHTFTGRRTTVRMLTEAGVQRYLADAEWELPLEGNATYFVASDAYAPYFRFVRLLRERRPAAHFKKLAKDTLHSAAAFLHTLQQRLEDLLGVRYSAAGMLPTPSAGFVALHYLMTTCSRVDVYGVAQGEVHALWEPRNPTRKPATSFTYFEEDTFLFTQQTPDTLRHSFELEYDILKVLEGAGLVSVKVPPVRGKAAELRTLENHRNKVEEATCVSRGHLWSPLRKMCVTVARRSARRLLEAGS